MADPTPAPVTHPGWRDIDPLGLGEWPYRFEQHGAHCFAFIEPRGLSNVAVIAAPEGLVMVDSTLHPYYARRICDELRRRFDRPILYLFNTHFHRDHTFGNVAIRPEWGVVAHARCADYLRRHGPAWLAELDEPYEGLTLRHPDLLFEDDLFRLPDLSVEVWIQRVGGHTHDSCVVFVPEDGVLIAGDSIFNGVTPYVGRWSCVDHFGRVTEWIKAIDAIREHAPEVILPGHGVAGSLRDADGLQRFFEYYAERVSRGVSQGRRLREIWDDIYRGGDLLRAELNPEVYLHMVMALYDELTGPSTLFEK